MKRGIFIILSIFCASFSFAQPKNIIIVMANGMGFNHANIITNNETCVLNSFDIQYASANYPTYWTTLDKEYDVQYYRGDYHVRRIWSEYSYTDSLPINALTAGSALATGVKPALNAVSYDMDDTELETLLERAVSKGMKTGIATDKDLSESSAILPFIAHAKVANDMEAIYNAATVSPDVTIRESDITSQMTDALNQLKNDKGFVFVSEFSKIETAAKAMDIPATKTAMESFDNLINTIYSWVAQNSSWGETLFIVTGTFEQGYLTSKSFSTENPLKNYLPTSKDDLQYNSQYPTNLLTPIYAHGNGSELFHSYIDETDFVFGSYINNTEISQICFRLLSDKITKPKNIIFMVNDGCGICPIKAADYYTGTTAQYEDFPVQVWNCTHASATSNTTNSLSSWNNTYESRLAWTGKDYLWDRNNATCSGASGTAMATGKKTYYYSLGVDIERNATKSIARHAKEIGKAAGVATNAPYYDATPGAFFTNNPSRTNYSDLSRQVIIESNADVIIGCDHPEYDKNGQVKEKPDYENIGGKEMLDDLRNGATEYQIASNSGWTTVRDIDGDGIPDPWTFVEDSASLVSYMTGETPKRLFALIPAEGSMQFYRTGTNVNEVHFDDWNPNMPRLWQIAKTAIHCLEQNKNGFFVMIEGDMVDNGGHKNWPGRQMEEQLEFNKTVDSVIAWIERNSSWDETLLIVTADHETGLMADPTFGEDSIMLNHHEIIDNGVGVLPGLSYYADDHSNQLVPLYAKGAGSEILTRYADEWDFVRGKFLNNSEIGQTMFELWDGQACDILNHCPTFQHNDTIFLKQDVDFYIELPRDIVTDVEDEVSIKLLTKPSWITYDPETFSLSGHTIKQTGTTRTTFAITDGATSGASITVNLVVLTCIYKETNTSAKPIDENSVSVYPNPAVTSISVKTVTNDGHIEIRSIDGKLVRYIPISNNITEISTTGMKRGEYIIQIIENDTVTTKKVLIL